MNGEEDSLKTEGDLKDWLVKGRHLGGQGVNETTLGKYYITLHRNGYNLKSTLIGIAFEELQKLNDSIPAREKKNKLPLPLIRHLVNKLEAGPDGKSYFTPCFLCFGSFSVNICSALATPFYKVEGRRCHLSTKNSRRCSSEGYSICS